MAHRTHTHKQPRLDIPEGLDAGALGHVPDADGLVLRVTEDEVLARVEDRARNIVEVPAARVNLPGPRFCNKRTCKMRLWDHFQGVADPYASESRQQGVQFNTNCVS